MNYLLNHRPLQPGMYEVKLWPTILFKAGLTFQRALNQANVRQHVIVDHDSRRATTHRFIGLYNYGT